MDRTQFTFYESFYKAISRIKKKADRADAFDAICAYALYGLEPNLESMPDAAAIAFELSKPNLDASRRKATSGKKGGERKQKESKSEANGKQSASKKENKKKNKKENECYNPLPPFEWAEPELKAAAQDWLKYKAERREAYKPTGLKNLEGEIRNNAEKYGHSVVAKLIRQCMASGWAGIQFDRLQSARVGGTYKPANGPSYTPQPKNEAESIRAEHERLRRLMLEDKK